VDPGLTFGKDADLSEKVDDIAGHLVQQGQAPGLVVGVLLADGTTRFYGYGRTNRESDSKPGPDTLFAIGSLSKGFLGALAASLVAEGQLSWTSTLSTLLPPGTRLSQDAARITLEQLASHTSGLPRQPFELRTLAYFTQYLFTGENFYRHLDRDALFAYLADFSAPSSPEPQYSNIGYGLLGYILEYRTGRSLDQLLSERITGPLALAHTGYLPEVLPGYPERAIGYAGDQPKFIRRGEPVPDWRFTEILRGSAALYSTARDLLAFAAAHLHRDGTPLSQSLSDGLRVRFQRPRAATAVAWIVDDLGDMCITYQIGFVGGYSSYLGMNEANGTAVVILQNAFNWDYSAGHTLLVELAHHEGSLATTTPPRE